jgi:Zn-finger nucleic acid-binding protein
MTPDECDHDAARVDHQEKRGPEMEFWIACPDCDGFWTLTGDLDRETAYISLDDGLV